MKRAIRRLWIASWIMVALGLAAFFFAYRPESVGQAGELAAVYARRAVRDRWFPIFTMLALAAALAAVLTHRLSGLRRGTSKPRVSASPFKALDADVLREMLAELRTELRRCLGAEPDMVRFVDVLDLGAVQLGASDIHLHPLDSGTHISFRVQGILQEIMVFPRELHKQLVSRIKVLARLNLFTADRPQDGHFTADTPSGVADIRVSVLPTNHGEKAVLRVANVGADVPPLPGIGLPPALVERFQAVLAKPQGMVFLTGPTGSGKTTTIYASLGHIKRSRGETTQIATIEDPVEFDIPFLTQTQVNSEVGLTFAQGLRSILRQDPNVIMVGEIRDAETAHIAVQAGLTGHQIVTTIHADSAAGVFNRIIEMGVEPFLIASASLASLSQRLVRGLCKHCRVVGPPSADEAARLNAAGHALGEFWTAPGCARCDQTGFLGRTPIFELLEVTPAIRDLVNQKVPTGRITEAAVAGGMIPLLAAGIERARAGDTTLREVFRVCG
jgi:general secretion pathway protein E